MNISNNTTASNTTASNTATSIKKAKDYASDQEIKWCPGCGDYSILKQTQTVLAEIGIPNHDLVFISGIGCSSRFPYYINSYGIHSIHGRAPGLASGLKAVRPELSVWLITGDGDSLSIGGNHTMHLLRRNFDVNVLLFNNQIYGLTKGQYSPTSPLGKVTKSTPLGSLDRPINPLAFALGCNATFIARTLDKDPLNMREVLRTGNAHKGTSFIEIYQNCNVFNDGAFSALTDKEVKEDRMLLLEEGMPLRFGKDKSLGILWNQADPKIVNIEKDGVAIENLWIHDSANLTKAQMLTQFYDDPNDDLNEKPPFPRPFGVFYKKEEKTYEQKFKAQNKMAYDQLGKGDLDELLLGKNHWEVK